MNKAKQRRDEIASLIANAKSPVTASALSEKFGVSRQVIVQDIAVLRAEGREILSTPRGYMMASGVRAERVFKCRHSLDDLLTEGDIIIKHGGKVEDIFVNHRIYGRISAKLELSTRTHVEELYRSLKSGASKPLMSVTDGYHYHTVSADSASALDEVEAALRASGILIEI